MEHQLRSLVEPIRHNLLKLVDHEKALFDLGLKTLAIKEQIDAEKDVIINYFSELNSKLGAEHQITEINFNGRPISIKTMKTTKKPGKTQILAICKSMLEKDDYENLLTLLKAEESEPVVRTVLSVAKTEDEKDARRKLVDSRKPK